MTDTGTLGNAQVATVEKGKKAVELMLDEMEDCVKNYLEK
jgi:creatinine amidohydrolase